MDLESGLQLAARHNQPSSPPRRTLERTDSAADHARNQANPTRTLTPDTVRGLGTSADAPQSSRSAWATLGKVASYAAVAGAAIGAERAGMAISHSFRAVPEPVVNWPAYVPTYKAYDNLQVHHSLTDAFEESLRHISQSRQMNETLAYLRKAPPNCHGEALTIDPDVRREGNSYDALANGIIWNPEAKYVFERESDGNRVISSATTLMKQLHNAKDALSNTVASVVRSGLGHPDFFNLQEKSAIEQTNAANREIGGGEIQHVNVEALGVPIETNSTLDTTLPAYVTSQFSGNSSLTVEALRLAEAGNTASSRTGALERLRKDQGDFFHNAGPEAQLYFAHSFNVANLQKIESLMRDGEAIVLESGNAAMNASSTAAFDLRLKNYTAVAESFAAKLFDNAHDTYSAHTFNKTNYNEIPAAEQFQMGAQANASLSKLEAQAPGTLEAQLAALGNSTTP